MKAILVSSGNLDKREQYNLLNAPVEKLSNHKGERFEVKNFILTENTNEQTGEVSMGFTFTTPDGDILGTGGKAFCEGVQMFINTVGIEELTTLEVGSKFSKSGREYLTFIA